jgi:predicted enzyme related to lactoylglutathione lyase
MTDGTDQSPPGDAERRGIPVTGVSELVLEVVDLGAAEDFYAGVLGLPVVDRWPEREAIWVMAGARTRIGLWRPQVGLARGRGGIHVHFAMHLAEADYDAAVARLKARGVYKEEHAFPGAGRAVYADDPDGNVVELWTWDVAGHLS